MFAFQKGVPCKLASREHTRPFVVVRGRFAVFGLVEMCELLVTHP